MKHITLWVVSFLMAVPTLGADGSKQENQTQTESSTESTSRSNGLRIAHLKNGSEYVEPLVNVILMALVPLIKSDNITDHLLLYELREKSRNPKHKFFGRLGDDLIAKGLVNKDGSVLEVVRDIMDSMTSGEGLDTTYSNPIVRVTDCDATLKAHND